MNLPDTQLFDQLAAAVAARITASIPIEFDLWGSAEIAAYLKVSSKHVLDRYAPMTDFPLAIRLPTQNGGHGQPRWKASEIIAWAEKYQEKKLRTSQLI